MNEKISKYNLLTEKSFSKYIHIVTIFFKNVGINSLTNLINSLKLLKYLFHRKCEL